LADKQEYSSSTTAVLTRHILAESAKIGHNLAGSTKSVNGFDRLVGFCCKNAGDMVSSASIQENRGVPFMNNQNPFKWRHYEADIILLCVRW